MKAALLAISLFCFCLDVRALAAEAKSEIATGNDKWIAAYSKGDTAALARLYTPGATVFPPGSPMVTGRAGIEKVWAAAIHNGLKIVSLQTVSIEQYGTVAREIGRFTVDSPNSPSPVEGKYVVIWKHVGGRWLLDSDIWNMNR